MNEYKKVVYYQNKKPSLGDDVLYFQYPSYFNHPSGGYGTLNNINKLKEANQKLRFYHTYWSKPALEANRWQLRNQHFLNVIIAAVSLYSLKRLGQEVVLHTDTEGAKLFSCLPYDHIYIDLDDNPAPITFWASGKFLSVIKGEDGIHIDTDMFITDSSIINTLAMNDNVVTNIESVSVYKDLIKNFIVMFDLFNINHPFTEDLNFSINCGIIKLSPEIKKTYVNYYYRFVKQMASNALIMEKFSIENQSLHSPDLVIEQLLLKVLLDFKKINPEFLINIFDYAAERKKEETTLCHLLSFEKYVLIPYLYRFLETNASDLLNSILNTFKDLFFELLIKYQ